MSALLPPKSELRARLDSLGLLGVARRLRQLVPGWTYTVLRELKARGLVIGWEPLVPEEEFTRACRRAVRTLRESGHEFGAYLEFGVSRGTSLACMYRILRDEGVDGARVVGFDSFQGMPPEAAEQGWTPGQYKSTVGSTRRYLENEGVDLSEVTLVEGWFEDTLTPGAAAEYGIDKASVVLVDCDIYSASRRALWFCEPLIEDEAVLILDDWGARSRLDEIGQREAFEEFLEAFPHFQTRPLSAYRPEARMFVVRRVE